MKKKLFIKHVLLFIFCHAILLFGPFSIQEVNGQISYQNCSPSNWSPTSSQNYVRIRDFKLPGVSQGNVDLQRNTCEVNQLVQYFDGLGRLSQEVIVQGSPTFRDIVTPIVYDEFGREPKKYLPYASTLGSSNGSYKSSGIADQSSFYNNPVGHSAPGVTTIAGTAFAETRFEASPLNRVLEQGAPGASWQLSAGHTSKLEYSTNNSSTAYGTAGFAVRLYHADEVLTSGQEHKRRISGTGYYGAGQLHLTISKDENWTNGKAGTVEQYTDAENRTVLKRTFNDNNGVIEVLSTYYIYDDLGHLSFALPPGANPDAANVPSQSVLDDFCYQYRYDGLGRLIEKKLPGKGWERMVYNRLDQLVLSQDTLRKSEGKWLFTKYDAFGRAVMTGVHNNSAERSSLQTLVDNQFAYGLLWEERDNSNLTAAGTGYTNRSFPTAGLSSYLTIEYYDDYSFYGNSFGQPSGANQVSGVLTKGLPTGRYVYELGSTTRYLSVYYYDEKNRVVQSKSQHHKAGTDVVNNTYSFVGELKSSIRTHISNGVSTTIATRYDYDHMGREKATFESINDGNEVVLNKLDYNELGQLQKKLLHSTDGSAFLQHTDYTYNERGWLKTAVSDQFSFRLKFDEGANKQYNGNIAYQDWGAGSSFPNTYAYIYDKLNRLTNGTSTGVVISEVVNYHPNGNIKDLNRDGLGAGIYSYINGNKLLKVAGGTLTTGNYSYDGNGNVVVDGRTGVTLTYNVLGLPLAATKTGLTLSYLYDGDGNKLRKTTNGAIRDYVDGIEYNANGSIDIIHTEGGIARNNGGVYTYEYHLTDHLGNTRLGFKKNVNSWTVEELQKVNYYAFGKAKYVNVGTNKYLYNGKELQSELSSLNQDGQYDYGARFYDPEIARWNVIDPLAEMTLESSPYTYVSNNPLRFIDPTGMKGEDWVEGSDGTIRWDSSVSSAGDIKSGSGDKYLGKTGYAIHEPTGMGIYYNGDGSTTSVTNSLAQVNIVGAAASFNAVDGLQMGLDGLGMTEIPFISQGAELISAGISFGRGDVTGGLIGLGSMIPLAGKGFEALKIGKRASRIFEVGSYDALRGVEAGLNAHHVGQKRLMRDFIPGYDLNKAPAILVPEVGHTIRGINGIVSRSTFGINSARQLLARDIKELRRVYPNVPNEALEKLIQMNRSMYPGAFKK